MLEYRTAGESHGKGVLAYVAGLPAGLEIEADFINRELARRQQGVGSGPRMTLERDRVDILSGVRWKKSLGSPIVGLITNLDYRNWVPLMDPEGTPPEEYRDISIPRPGHADLSGMLKYRFRDIRNVIERSSARETAGRCFAGALAKLFLAAFGVVVGGFVEVIGGVSAPPVTDFQEAVERSAGSPVSTPDLSSEAKMIEAIETARDHGETLGGVFVVAAFQVLPGLGGYVQAGERLDGRIARAMIEIPAVKGVEIGDAFRNARVVGSLVHDRIVPQPGRLPFGLKRMTNYSGGIEGGTTTGETVWVRCAMKPIPTLQKGLETVDLDSGQPTTARYERSDICAVPRAMVVAEAMLAWELARVYQEKLGGDSMAEIMPRFQEYSKYLKQFLERN